MRLLAFHRIDAHHHHSQIDIINRMLAPILPLAFILLLGTVALLNQNKHRLLVLLSAVVLLVGLRFNYYQSSSFISEMKENGHGYANREYRQSGLIEHIQAIPDDQRMVSNAAAFVLYYTNRFPIQVDQFANRTFGTTDGYGEKWVREKGAALIILYPEFRISTEKPPIPCWRPSPRGWMWPTRTRPAAFIILRVLFRINFIPPLQTWPGLRGWSTSKPRIAAI